ncbi:MAG: tetratricopeptide repeat protein [Candidatus Methylomirabilota bacterium]
MLRRLVCLLALALLALIASPSPAFPIAPAVRAGMLRATDLLLNRDVGAAEAECNSLLNLPEGEATGRFCLGLVTLTRAEDKDDPTPDLDRFLVQAAEAVAAAEAQERSQPADAEVKLLLGLAHGNKALVDGGRKNYLAALASLREAHRRFEEALKLDPNLADAYYGIGLYNYALGRLPVLLKPLVSIVLPPGDPAHGLQELERVAKDGTFLRMTARVALLHLYASREENYAEALRLGRDLLSRYPGNADLYFATAHAASELGRGADALEIARRVARNMAQRRPHFGPEIAGRYAQLMGKIYMDQGEHATALTFFQRALETPTPPRYFWVIAWAWTRSGMIYDLQGDREEAVRRYRKALAVPTGALAQDVARRYLETPYRGRPRSAS